DRAFAKFWNFKDTHGAIPQNRFGFGDSFLVKGNICRAKVDRLPAVADAMLRRESARVSHVSTGANFIRLHNIDRNQKFYLTVLSQIEKLPRQIDLVQFDAACAN